MLSRVADSLYWMSRYLERAEHTARVLDVHLNLMLEQPAESSQGRWTRVRATLGIETPAQVPLEEETHAILDELAFHPGNKNSIVSFIMSARDNARQVREQISSEMWEQLNRLFHEVRRAEHGDPLEGDPLEFLHAVKEGAHLFQGLTDSTMSHGEGWHFIQLGRALERTASTANLVTVHFAEFHDPRDLRLDAGPDMADYLEWIGLLKCATAFEAYCKVYTAAIDARRVAEFLVLNGDFPHSLRFAADRLQAATQAIAEVSPSRRGARVERLAGRMKASLGFAQIDEVLGGGLHAFLDDVRKQCAQVHSAVYQGFITYPIETALEA